MNRSALTTGLVAIALALSGCAETIAAPAPLPAPPAAAPAAPASPTAENGLENGAANGPALWKVADADTTIYLFGTVHALPEGTEWYRGALVDALASAQVLVTEVETRTLLEPATQQEFLTRGALPAGQTLRGLLDPQQRATLEGALTRLGMPVAALDRVEPWFAAMTLAAIPLMKAGYRMDSGAEVAIEGKIAKDTPREALETVESQLAIFDTMPMPLQIAYLLSVAKQVDTVGPEMNAMVEAWRKGDADRLATLMNAEIDDPALAEHLLYERYRAWAKWVEARLARPGTVFVAVGAGHLAGANSVQDYLARDGVAVSRAQ